MVTLLQLINHVGNGFDVSSMAVTVLKTSLALDNQKIIRQRFRALLDEDPSKTLEALQNLVKKRFPYD